MVLLSVRAGPNVSQAGDRRTIRGVHPAELCTRRVVRCPPARATDCLLQGLQATYPQALQAFLPPLRSTELVRDDSESFHCITLHQTLIQLEHSPRRPSVDDPSGSNQTLSRWNDQAGRRRRPRCPWDLLVTRI